MFNDKNQHISPFIRKHIPNNGRQGYFPRSSRGIQMLGESYAQNHNSIEQEHNYSQLSHFIDEEIEIVGNCNNCSHMCRSQTHRLAKVHISLHFHPTQLSLYCSAILFSVPPLSERVLLASGRSQIIEQWSISLKLCVTVGEKNNNNARFSQDTWVLVTTLLLTTCQTLTRISTLGP